MKPEDRYDSLIQFYAQKRGLDWLLMKAQVKQESAFDPDARSSAGAVGLCQFMPGTWKEWQDGTPGIQPIPTGSKLSDPRDPEDAIQAQSFYLRWLLDLFAGDEQKALAGYNYGPTNVRKAVIAMAHEWSSLLPPETQDYVVRVQKYRSEYRTQP